LRPIHHQLEHRIEAHIFVAFLAYCLHVTLRARLKPLADGSSPGNSDVVCSQAHRAEAINCAMP
jgi:hypothetical protein